MKSDFEIIKKSVKSKCIIYPVADVHLGAIECNENAWRQFCKRLLSDTFAVTHGIGGGIFTGAAINRNERFGNVIEGLDCLIVGHTHKGSITRPSKLVFDSHNNVVTMKSYLVVSCVSWLSYGGYAMQKMLLPAENSNPQKLLLSDDHHKKRIDIIW